MTEPGAETAGATVHLRPDQNPVLSVRSLQVGFGSMSSRVQAVDDVSFDVLDGETVGLVGESGCGKSTTGLSILQLPPPDSGSIEFEGRELTTLSANELRTVRPRLQMIFQDPVSALNPRRRIVDIVREGLAISGDRVSEDDPRVLEAMTAVGLDPALVANRRPHEFSGGQCQRICIARALIMNPRLVICDEPVSALDVSIQAQILNLLEDAKDRYRLSLLFISHDLAVVSNVSDRVIVMYAGTICEVAETMALFDRPAHPYTRVLLGAIPGSGEAADEQSERPADGAFAGAIRATSSGCPFLARCPNADARCAVERPQLRRLADGHFVACHHPLGTFAA